MITKYMNMFLHSQAVHEINKTMITVCDYSFTTNVCILSLFTEMCETLMNTLMESSNSY